MDTKALLGGLVKTLNAVSKSVIDAAAKQQPNGRGGLAPKPCGKCPASGFKAAK